jgi:hypothetical protein
MKRLLSYYPLEGTHESNCLHKIRRGGTIAVPVAPRDGRERFQMGEAGEPQQGNPIRVIQGGRQYTCSPLFSEIFIPSCEIALSSGVTRPA